MGVYHITYIPELKEICLYLDGGCNFSCHGCITTYHPEDYHLEKNRSAQGHRHIRNKTLNIEEVISYLKPLYFKKAIFLGKEPTEDSDFLPLAKILKEYFHSYNVLLTNGYKFRENIVIDEVCVSIKAISKWIFRNFTGRSDPERVLKNFKRYVSNHTIKVRAESIFIPGYIGKEEIERIAQFIASIDPSIPYRIDGYIPYSENDRFRRPTKDEMEEAMLGAKKYLQNVSILHFGTKVKYKVKRIY